jgi:pectinesterase
MTLRHLSTAFVLILAAVLLWSFAPASSPTIFLIGDSTMADKELTGGNTERGWGMVFPSLLSPDVRVENHAQNGRSSKSFIGEGRWQTVESRIKPGDYVFIQFGHNDQKSDTLRHTDPQTTYKENLRRYISETRAKGGIPVLFTSIARRKFGDDGKLIDTHKGYITAMKEVGAETGTPVIDMNARSIALFEAAGVEGTKKLFNHVAPKAQAWRPEGKEDDTHFCYAGARALAEIAAEELAVLFPELKAKLHRYDLVVAQDGSGEFFTVQDAVNAVLDYRKDTTTIYIRKGSYDEKVVIPESKQLIKLIGEERDSTVITHDDYAKKLNRFGEEKGTSGSATLYIYGPSFTAQNLTFANTAGRVGQAVAVLVKADKAAFFNCRFLGNQDTLYTYGEQDGSLSRQYYEDCYVEGTVDFIFGWATAVFNRCEIHALADGYLTAASTPQGQAHGLLFTDCRLTAEPGVKSYLGRPWRPYAQTVYINCEMGGHIRPEGWHNWGKPEAEKQAFYAEYGSTGEGAAAASRVKWSKQLTAKQAAQQTPAAWLGDWAPMTK